MQFYKATMTTKGSLVLSIFVVKRFSVEYFQVQFWDKSTQTSVCVSITFCPTPIKFGQYIVRLSLLWKFVLDLL